MRLYFIRHGQTNWNIARRFQSRTDVPLNETGRRQAGEVRKLLDSNRIEYHRIYTSPLKRARETAEIIAAGHDAEIVVEPEFRELDVGEYEGREERLLRDELGDRYKDWRANCFRDAAPGGESILDVMERVRNPLKALICAEGAENRLIVAHQAVNAAMKAVLSGKTDPRSLRKYMQGNDEIDVWDSDRCELAERVKLPTDRG